MLRLIITVLLFACSSHIAKAQNCSINKSDLPVSRHVQIDTSQGPIFGAIVRYAAEPDFLKPKEVVLTFDDGPSPRITRSILQTLDRFCVKATFFPVGRMALTHSSVMREIAEKGHTIGTHTWSHPNNLRRLSRSEFIEELEKGFASIALASGQAIAPFFRFPGLNDDARALKYLQKRGVATFSVDVVSEDSYTRDADQLTKITLSRVTKRNGGILLFHDIKSSTAEALPQILEGLAKRGFRIVHLTSKFALTPLGSYEQDLRRFVGKKRFKRPLSVSMDGLQGTIRPSLAIEPSLHVPPVTFLTPGRKEIELASTRNARIENLTKKISLRGLNGFIDHHDMSKKQ